MKAIHELISYGLKHDLLNDIDVDYVNNQLSLFLACEVDPFKPSLLGKKSILDILSPLIERAFELKLIPENTVTYRDLIEAKIMDFIIARPSDFQKHFEELYQISPQKATDDFYLKSIQTNYIKTHRIEKNISYTVPSDYGKIHLTINLSKPEKDPKEIEKALKEVKTSYPSCLLCKENVGFFGSLNHPGRSNHRVIKRMLHHEPFYIQYSPYVYYNEHMIVLHEKHIPMNVNKKTFYRLFDFIDQFPHYFIGSNAGLPIVGGSILSHEHYQGGRHTFPIEDAHVLKSYEKAGVIYEILKWPLSVIRLKASNKEALINQAEFLRQRWLTYQNEHLGIFSSTGKEPHNAITPIARKENETYILDIALRNNKTNEQFPMGVFHPHPERHHIKKENIGLIEVMGLAILPGRLKKDLEFIADVLTQKIETFDGISLYDTWIQSLKKDFQPQSNAKDFVYLKAAEVFISGLEDCAVFKQNEEGFQAFNQFLVEALECF